MKTFTIEKFAEVYNFNYKIENGEIKIKFNDELGFGTLVYANDCFGVFYKDVNPYANISMDAQRFLWDLNRLTGLDNSNSRGAVIQPTLNGWLLHSTLKWPGNAPDGDPVMAEGDFQNEIEKTISNIAVFILWETNPEEMADKIRQIACSSNAWLLINEVADSLLYPADTKFSQEEIKNVEKFIRLFIATNQLAKFYLDLELLPSDFAYNNPKNHMDVIENINNRETDYFGYECDFQNEIIKNKTLKYLIDETAKIGNIKI